MDTAVTTYPLPDELRCFGCGYEVGGQSAWRCPECGREVGQRDIAAFAEFSTERGPQRARRLAMQWLSALSLMYGVGAGLAMGAWEPGFITTLVLLCVGFASMHFGRLAVASRRAVQRHALETAWLRHLPWLVSPLLVVPAGVIFTLFLVPFGWAMQALGISWSLLGAPLLWRYGFLKSARKVGVRRLGEVPIVVLAAALCTIVWSGLAMAWVYVVVTGIIGRI
ncbi:MAG: hypothetical protein K2Q20_05910 [Phycisphaerales bacterium]|nr:hypothetical protein [Phycisphaerales bacterium]